MHAGDLLRFYVEGKSALSTYDRLPGGKRISDEDPAEIQQIFVDLIIPMDDDQVLTIRPGHQAFLFGKQRLVSLLPRSNTMRGGDGVRAILELNSGWGLHGFWSQCVPVRKCQVNTSDAQTQGWGLSIRSVWERLASCPSVPGIRSWPAFACCPRQLPVR